MKVTILSSLPPIKGGISKYTANLAENLASHYEVEALTFRQIYPEKLYPGGTRDNDMRPPKSSRLFVRPILTWYNPISWLYAAFSLRGDVLHAQWWTYVLTPVYFTILSISKLLRRKRIVLTIHNVKPHESNILSTLADKLIYSLADHFIVHSEDNKRVFMKSHKVAAAKVSVIPIGILPPDVPIEGISQIEARRMLKLPRNAKVVLFFGIIREYKGLDTLIEAVAMVREQIPEAVLVVAGKPWEAWEAYQEIIDQRKLKAGVRTYLEFIPEAEMELYFSAADAVVLPYRHFDSQTAAGATALSFGKAMVVTSVGGLPQNVKDKQAICKPDDPEELSSKLSAVLTNKKLRAKLEKDSRMLSKELSWEKIGHQTASQYEQLFKK